MPRSKKENAWNYEEAVARVEAIVDNIENGTLPLEAVFEQFSAATEQLRECEEFLQKGKEKMELSIELLTAETNGEIDF